MSDEVCAHSFKIVTVSTICITRERGSSSVYAREQLAEPMCGLGVTHSSEREAGFECFVWMDYHMCTSKEFIQEKYKKKG